MRVKPRGLSTCVKFASHDWLLLDPPELSETGSDLKITCRRGIALGILSIGNSLSYP